MKVWWNRGGVLVGDLRQLRQECFDGPVRAGKSPLLLQPSPKVSSGIHKATMVRVDKMSDTPQLTAFLGEQHSRTLVVRAGAAPADPTLTLKQVALPFGIRLPRIVQESGDVCEASAAKVACTLLGKRSNAAQVVGKGLPLPPGVRRVRVQRGFARAVRPASVAQADSPANANSVRSGS